MAESRRGPGAQRSVDSAHRRSRKFRLGPSKEGMSGWAPMPQDSSPHKDTDLESETRQIGHALAQAGPLSRSQLRERVGGRFWGPRRFAHALRHALKQGVIRSTGQGSYVGHTMAADQQNEGTEKHAGKSE